LRLRTLYRPEVFQGDLNGSKYFEGWYFKHVSAGQDQVIAVIPGISLAGKKHSFIQIIDGTSGLTRYLEFPLSDFSATRDKLDISIGKNRFSPDSIELDINQDETILKGSLRYSGRVQWPGSLIAPGIMGWYSFVPRMECYHGVVSLDHSIEGIIDFQGRTIDFNQGRGYIEKDWGTSMPESWIWLHANTFETQGTSVMVSVAKIPWQGRFFIGFLCFVLINGRIYKFMTYNNSRIRKLSLKEEQLELVLENRNHTLRIEGRQKKAGSLKAPVHGLMERHIKESIDSDIFISLQTTSGEILYEGNARKAGLELVGNMDELINFATK